MFKLPSLKALSESLLQTILNYRWVTLVAFMKAFLFIYLIETDYQNKEQYHLLTRLCYLAFLALPLTLSIEFLHKRRGLTISKLLILFILLVALLALYFFTMHTEPATSDRYRFFIFLLGSHLIVSYAPFLGFGEPNGFWQFNKTLFLQFLNATLYAVTLYIGLLIAVETVIYLFNVKFLFEIEQDIAVLIFTIFHTVFFLSKIPEPFDAFESQDDYPSGLKMFTQYVLLPLEVVYLMILYTYTGKMIIQWKLPEGGVANLVLAFSVAGILALLLLHPLRKNQNERWIGLFSHRFYLALLPLIVLLFIGIFRRIHDYGVTENRYIVAGLAIWLTGATVYFLLVKKNDIRRIPVTLSALCFLVPIGPWNMFSISEKSQLERFQKILAEHRLLNPQNKIEGKATLPDREYEQLFSIARFFENRDAAKLKPFFKTLPEKNSAVFYSVVEEELNQHVSRQNGDPSEYLHYSSGLLNVNNPEVDINGFEKLLFVSDNDSFPIVHEEYKIYLGPKGKVLQLYRDKENIMNIDIEKKVFDLRKRFGKQNENIPLEELNFDSNDPTKSVRVIFRNISLSGENFFFEGLILFR